MNPGVAIMVLLVTGAGTDYFLPNAQRYRQQIDAANRQLAEAKLVERNEWKQTETPQAFFAFSWRD
jgi:hypothetical protein